MTREYAARTLTAALAELAAARKILDAARPKSRAWYAAEEDVNFWGGKVANMQAALQVLF